MCDVPGEGSISCGVVLIVLSLNLLLSQLSVECLRGGLTGGGGLLGPGPGGGGRLGGEPTELLGGGGRAPLLLLRGRGRTSLLLHWGRLESLLLHGSRLLGVSSSPQGFLVGCFLLGAELRLLGGNLLLLSGDVVPVSIQLVCWETLGSSLRGGTLLLLGNKLLLGHEPLRLLGGELLLLGSKLLLLRDELRLLGDHPLGLLLELLLRSKLLLCELLGSSLLLRSEPLGLSKLLHRNGGTVLINELADHLPPGARDLEGLLLLLAEHPELSLLQQLGGGRLYCLLGGSQGQEG